MSCSVILSGTRPKTHWDAVFTEVVPGGSGVTKPWTMHIGDSFVDVPRGHRYARFVETLLHHGVVGGCAAGQFCPNDPLTREQLAVIVLAAAYPGWTPPACQPGPRLFGDVPASSPYCPWIEEMARRGAVFSCSPGWGLYCPTAGATRRVLARAVMVMSNPADYMPSPCTGTVYLDVDATEPECDWIEALAAKLEPILPPPDPADPSCGPEHFCPSDIASRQVGSHFIVSGFKLRLYGP